MLFCPLFAIPLWAAEPAPDTKAAISPPASVSASEPAPQAPPKGESRPATTHSSKTGEKAAGPDNNPFELSSGNGPIAIQSESLSLDYKGKTIVFRGHVHAVQSATELVSDVLQVSYGKDFNDIKLVVADGNVKISQGGR